MKRPKLLASLAIAVAGVAAFAFSVDSKPGPAPREYVGQQTCVTANCHESGYSGASDYKGLAEFKKTLHQQIHLRPTPETVVIDRMFDKDTVISTPIVQIRYPGRDTLNARLFKSPDKKDYYVQLFFSGGGDSTPAMKVAFTYGGRGWIERYLVEVDGRHYVPPFQYSLPRYKERADTGGWFYWLDFSKWYGIDQSNQEGVFYEFGSTTFKKQAWDEQCASCHINGMTRSYVDGDTAKIYTLNFVGSDGADSLALHENILIGCESCHGPGSEHVANPTAENIVSPGKSSQFPRTPAGIDLKLDLCGQCHERFKSTGGTHNFAYDEVNDQPFIPGSSLRLFQKDSLTGMNRWPDGVTSYAHHQTGQDFRFSKPYLAHVFSDGCWSCHTVHYNKYDSSFGGELPYQLDRNWYSLAENQGCVASGCHPDKREVGPSPLRNGMMVNLHTQHAQEISQCVNCHFTKTASIGFVDLPQKPLQEFSNHNFRVLSPQITIDYFNTGGLGMMNTCAASCHRNGRGSRNFADSTPVAPSFGINDQLIGLWGEITDKRLADSLLKYYKDFWPSVGGVRLSAHAGGGSGLKTIAPNPMVNRTEIRYDVTVPGAVSIQIFNTNGARVRTLIASDHDRGTYTCVWYGSDDGGHMLPNGTYLVRMLSSNGVMTGEQVVLVR